MPFAPSFFFLVVRPGAPVVSSLLLVLVQDTALQRWLLLPSLLAAPLPRRGAAHSGGRTAQQGGCWYHTPSRAVSPKKRASVLMPHALIYRPCVRKTHFLMLRFFSASEFRLRSSTHTSLETIALHSRSGLAKARSVDDIRCENSFGGGVPHSGLSSFGSCGSGPKKWLTHHC